MADVPEVKVLALSPRCWPVSPLCYMENPGRFFPAVLSSPLEEFADFCQQSECCGRGCALTPQGISATSGGGWECLAGLVPIPGSDTVPGRPEPAGLGVHEAPSAAVDVAGPRRAAVWRLRSARVHAADVHPAVLQQRPGRGWGHTGARGAVELEHGRAVSSLPFGWGLLQFGAQEPSGGQACGQCVVAIALPPCAAGGGCGGPAAGHGAPC